ncbi:MAG: branched-chain amino acid ABC transporter permease [Sneathiellaceae bacterium]
MTAGEALRRFGLPVVVVLLCVLPLLTSGEYYLTIGIAVATFAVLSTGLNLVYGYVGLLSFAQIGFFGIGGYASAILVVDRGWSIWTGSLAGGGLALLAGLVVAYSSLRLSRHAFAIVTLSFGLLCLIVARDWVSLTRGPAGMPGLPIPEAWFPILGDVRFDRPEAFYGLMLANAVVALAIMHRIIHSRIGRALRAIKLNEPLAQSQGINPLRYKLLTIGVSAFLSGVTGGLYVFYLTIVDPSIFDFYYTETILIMVIAGGPGSFWAVLAASLVFSVLPELLRFSTDLRMVMYGAVLIVAMLAFPRGVGGLLRDRALARWRRAQTQAGPAE